jgi:hypothetical protein
MTIGRKRATLGTVGVVLGLSLIGGLHGVASFTAPQATRAVLSASTQGFTPTASQAVRAQARIDVTANPTVRRDLAFAVQFWQFERPDLTARCAPERVVFTRMSNGVGNEGGFVPASIVWAQTRLRDCEILISRAALTEIEHAPTIGGRYGICTIVWHGSTGTCSTNGYSQLDVCIRIAHEYAHTLGLGDTTHGPAILNQAATGGDPICSLAYDPHHLSRSASDWLSAHGINPNIA